ncbi:efflux RND transporter periplasmic adaptor subunit, partial [Calditrichota bacterium]
WLVLVILFMSLAHFHCGQTDAKSETENNGDSTKVETNEDEKSEKKDEKKNDLIPVEITTIKKGTISDYILLSTNLETEEQADVYSRVQGIVKKIHYDEGDFVKSGSSLMELEADEYVLAEKRAKLNYLKQKADFDRMLAMFDENLLSKEEFEQARFATEGLEVDWEQAKLNLSYTKINSPISGVIGDRLRKPGDRIQPTDKLFSVINTNEMIAIVYVPEKEIGRVQKEQIAYITSDNLKDTRFTGWLKRVSPVIDPASGTFKVTIGVKNKNNILRAGMFVNAFIVTSTHEDAVLVPKTAIVYENEAMNVFVVKDSIAHKIALRVGFQDHEKVESLSELKEGDKVIVVGQAGLKDQTKVKVVSERENTIAMKKDEIYKGQS